MKTVLGLLTGLGLGVVLMLSHYATAQNPLPPCPSPTPHLHPIFATATACRGDCLKWQTPTQEISASPTPSPTLTPTPTPAPVGNRQVVVVSPNGLNIRSSASPNAPIEGRLVWGQVVTITGQTVVSGGITWGRLADGRGWIALQDNAGNVYAR